MERRERLAELDYFNAIACLLVMLIHVLSLGITELDRGSWQAAAVYLPWRLAAFAVPAFLFCGAVKLGVRCQKEDGGPRYGPYILGRVRKVYLPYVIAVVVYYVVLAQIHYVTPSWKGFFSYLWLGNLSSQFYYIVITMQFYLLMPLWRWLVRRVPWYEAMLWAAAAQFLVQKGGAWLGFPWTDRVFPTYLVFWTAGLYAGRHYGAVRARLEADRRVIAWSALPVALCALVNWRQFAAGWEALPIDMDVLKLFTDGMSILLLLTACVALQGRAAGLERALRGIHRASFFVYLSHCLVLTLATDWLLQAGVYRVSAQLAVRAAACFTVPFLVYFVYDKIRRRVKCM